MIATAQKRHNALKWFRFYHEVLEDTKVQSLDGDTFKRWVNVLCFASQQEPRGSIPDDPHAVAFRLHIRLDAARRFLDDMRKRGLLEQHPTISGRLVPHNWEKRQQSSDDSAPRVAKSRAVSPEKNRVNVTAATPLPKRRNSPIEGERDSELDHSPTESGVPAPPDATPARAVQERLQMPKAPTTDAVRAANTILGKKCNEAERLAINEAIPATPQALTLWESVLRVWKLRYERNRSLEGPMEWFAAGGPPQRAPVGAGASTNGSYRPVKAAQEKDDDRFSAFEKYS